VFDGVVREHRDTVLGWCAERLWPDADAAVAAARDVFLVAYRAMADPAKLARPDRLRGWLLGIAAYPELASGLSPGIDAINWGALQAGIAADVPDSPDTRGSAARRASLRRWLELVVATLPEPRQQLYDLFVLRALNSRNAATELGTDVAEAQRLRRENREAVLRAFEVSALAAADATVDPLGGESLGCGQLRQILADAERNGGMHEGARSDGPVLPADLRPTVTRHAGQCGTCRDRRDDCMAQWAPEVLPILAGAELNERVIEDLRTIPEPATSATSARSRAGAPAGGHPLGRRGAHQGAALIGTAPIGTAPIGIGRAGIPWRAASVAGAGLVVVLLLLGFVQPGFLLNTAASLPRGSSSAPAKDPSHGPGGGDPQLIGTSAQVHRRPAPSSPGGTPSGTGGGSASPTWWSAAPTQSVSSTARPSSSPSTVPTSTSPVATLSPTPSASTRRPSPSPSTTPSSSPAPTPTPTTTPPTSSPSPSPSPSSPTPSAS
jgi:DNA-directed RNA polymerase specialized sigma24 family protein